MKKTFYSHGKLLLTGEYFVLDGAHALAVPCKFGQTLEVYPSIRSGIEWSSYAMDDNRWFHHHFSIESLKQKPENKPNTIEDTLQKILHYALQQNPSFYTNLAVRCTTKLEFPRDWGLGSSSTLICNIAQWVGVDAYALLENSFGGSGYDIAAAKSKTAFVYKRDASPRAKEVDLDWEFTDSIFFVHRNQKQDSKEGIAQYRTKATKQKDSLYAINALTEEFITAKTLEQLSLAIEKHEKVVGTQIEMKPIKEKLFPDYPHAIKSLGAWGGDFFMVLGKEEDKAYFKNKGYHTILSYADIVL